MRGIFMKEVKRRYYNEYVNGSTVRKLETIPDYEQERQRRPERQIQSRPVKQPKPIAIDLFSFFMLTIAIVATVAVCIEYLQVQHELTTLSKDISSIEKEVLNLKNENDAAYAKIITSVDMAYVYGIATGKLGMVHANNNQVISYESIKSDFVKQYGELPKGKQEGIASKIMK